MLLLVQTWWLCDYSFINIQLNYLINILVPVIKRYNVKKQVCRNIFTAKNVCFAGSAAKPILWEFFKLYPTAERAVQAEPRDLASMLNSLGLHAKRAHIILRFTGQLQCMQSYTLYSTVYVHVRYIYTYNNHGK